METNAQINNLVDIALELKQQIENRNIDKIQALFHPNARINVYGRFYDLKTFLTNLHKLLALIEQPGLDITSVDESEINSDHAFISMSIELFWIDQKTWEEISQLASLSLELVRERQTENEQRWLISGFTLARNKKVQDRKDPPLFPKDTKQPNFLDGIFNFWY
jgi:hypothetical protein